MCKSVTIHKDKLFTLLYADDQVLLVKDNITLYKLLTSLCPLIKTV